MEIFIVESAFSEVVDFFGENLNEENEAIFSEEFLCSAGLTAAARRRQVVVCRDQGKIVAGARFYPRKKDKITSLYQFAINKDYRGKNLLQNLLCATEYKIFESVCPKDAAFNDYYKKTGWKLRRKNDINNYWVLDLT